MPARIAFVCSLPDCDSAYYALGMCQLHYGRMRNHGSTEKPQRARDVGERIDALTDKSGDCWIWLGSKTDGGYGTIGIAGKNKLVHRVNYERFVGPIPEGLCIDHLCRVRACCNPAHLEAVTYRENNLRGMAPTFVAHRAGTCTSGHEMTPENSYVRKNDGKRVCRTCMHRRYERMRDTDWQSTDSSPTCKRGHDRSEYGKRTSYGAWSCIECKRINGLQRRHRGPAPGTPTCSEGCDRPVVARGLCNLCYCRKRYSGELLTLRELQDAAS
jgi:HNH endonuclease